MAKRSKPKSEEFAQQLPKGVVRALADRKPSADSEKLLIDLIDVWGGTRQLALDLHKEFQAAGAGSMVRQRILEMIQRLVVTNTTHQIGSPIKPEDLTDGDLEQTALDYVKRLSGDGTPTTT